MTSVTSKRWVATAVTMATVAMTSVAAAGTTTGGVAGIGGGAGSGAAPWLRILNTVVGWLDASVPGIIVIGVFYVGLQMWAMRSQGMTSELMVKAIGGSLLTGAATIGPQLFSSGLSI